MSVASEKSKLRKAKIKPLKGGQWRNAQIMWPPRFKSLAEVDRYERLNDVERRIVDGWMSSGLTAAAALARFEGDLSDAADEDGYDGP